MHISLICVYKIMIVFQKFSHLNNFEDNKKVIIVVIIIRLLLKSSIEAHVYILFLGK